jgi:uncharacterized protein DUF5677
MAGATEDEVSEWVKRLTRDSGARLSQVLAQRAPAMARKWRRAQRGFERRLVKRWHKALELFLAVYVSCLEFGAAFSARYDVAGSYRLQALVRVHGRSCLTASEVYSLLRTGHANGAMARARALHEHAVVAFVLAEGSEVDAERFLEHSVVGNYRRAVEFQRLAEQLGYEPFSELEMERISSEYERACARWGCEFRHQYGWASTLVGSRRPTFRDLELHVGLDHLRPYYQWYSDAVHAGSKAAATVVTRGPHSILLAGPSNADLADPGQSAMVSLQQGTSALVLSQKQPHVDDLVQLIAVQRLVECAQEAFVAAHRTLEADEASIVWPELA